VKSVDKVFKIKFDEQIEAPNIIIKFLNQ